MSATCPRVVTFWAGVICLAALVPAQRDPDRDGDGLSDFHEIHKYKTDPAKADSDGDGIPDGDWRERREYQYTVRTVVHVMRPVTPEYLNDDYQDARVLDETATHVELEVIHYPFNTVADAIVSDPKWRATARRMKEWTAPGPAANWNQKMQRELLADMKRDGLKVDKLADKELVEQASKWLCKRAEPNNCFTTFVTAFDDKGNPYLPEGLREAVPSGLNKEELSKQWNRDILARGMFEQGIRGSCSSSATYLNGCLRALGVPTRIVLCIPIVDANDESEIRLLKKGIRHRALQRDTSAAIERIRGSWASHTFNEVFVAGRWRRLNYDRLGQDIRDPGMFGILTHVATFSDWSEAEMPKTIGKRQTFRRYDDIFGYANPYSTIALRDEFGVHSEIQLGEPITKSLRITGAEWGDRAGADDVRDWFKRRGVFGLVARVEGAADGSELRSFLSAADHRVFLVADGHPTLGVGLEAGAWWFREAGYAEIVVPFGGADQRDLVTDVPYRVVTRNQGEEAHWQVDDDLRVVRKS